MYDEYDPIYDQAHRQERHFAAQRQPRVSGRAVVWILLFGLFVAALAIGLTYKKTASVAQQFSEFTK